MPAVTPARIRPQTSISQPASSEASKRVASGRRALSEREVEAVDLDASFYRDEQIDLGELVREQFYLVLPMKPLCTDACRGLCSQCGTNLNISTCGCTFTWDDPRLAPLKRFR